MPCTKSERELQYRSWALGLRSILVGVPSLCHADVRRLDLLRSGAGLQPEDRVVVAPPRRLLCDGAPKGYTEEKVIFEGGKTQAVTTLKRLSVANLALADPLSHLGARQVLKKDSARVGSARTATGPSLIAHRA